MADTATPSEVLRGLASGIPEPQQRWSRGEGLGGKPTAEANADPKPAADAKADPKAEPKPTGPTATGTTPDADPKPAADTKAPDSGKPKAEPKRFSPAVGKTLTNLGLPPSAVRNLKTAPVKGVAGLAKGQWNAGQHYAGKLGDKLGKLVPTAGGKGLLKGAMKFVPGLGAAVAGYAAIKAFQRGDYVGAALNAVAMIPGPVGWIAAGASVAWELTGWGDRYGEWAPPDGVNTFMLQGEAKDVAYVKEIDGKLRTAQNSVFAYQEGPTGTVWDSAPPPPVELATADVVAEATAWLTGISDHFAAIDKAMTDSGEQYFSEQRQALAPHFSAMAKLKGEVKALTDQLAAMDKGAKSAYDAVTGANRSARGQLASSGSLTDAGPATTAETKVQQGLSAVKAAESKIEKLWSETPPAVVLVRDLTANGAKPAPQKVEPVKPVTATPAAVTPSVQTPAAQTPAKTETPSKNNDDLSKLLSQLGNKTQTPTSGSPLGTGSGLGGGSPLGTGTGQSTGGGTPLATSKPDTSEKKDEGKKLVDDKKTDDKKAEPRKLADEKSLSGAKPEQAKAAVPAGEQKPVAPAAAVTVPGAAAPTPAQQNAEAAAKAAEPSKEVDVKGQKTTFPDAKTAKLAELLSKADPTHPMSLADAAAQAGLTPPVPGQDPGTQVNPAQAKPGDIMVAADKSYMLLGDGKFYDLQDYKVIGSSELPQNMGDRAGYFHLVDPNPGQAAPAAPTGDQAPAGAPAPAQPQGPVSGQTGGVQNAVPGATGAPQGPQPGAPAGTGGVPSVGAPGVPKPGGSGPANAASTSTGTGQGGPSTGGQSLDPGAVR
ncbi:hypothetical protein [Mycobacteroides chelonae]|uniref:hypothetical protein n=1 Tax=Mycobacteroides chelonae TaxID=1774 RepID=UPI000992178F|nr:hypothetical protein [Mycobacteroides chelonae]